MRDVDLVAAVAQTDESATATSQIVAARSSLVAQWVEQMGLGNVTCEKNRARVVGKLGEYSVNLASGVVFKYPLPSRYVCIVPGRRLARDEVYLPFADSGAKEREIISKILLLCNDDKIEDELILEQIDEGGVD